MNASFLFQLLKRYVPIGYRFYFRKFTIQNLDKIPASGPVIFAINHQNAFMDAIVVATSTRRNPWFLARASVFESKIARFWLNQLQMIPIYRFRDGHKNMKKNDETVEVCKNLLLKNETILIFPEGNHDLKWTLRPLQKGIARIAFATEEACGFTSGLHIVPIGLQYENHTKSWSDLLISFGEPIALKDYEALYSENVMLSTNKLLDDISASVSNLMVDIRSADHFDAIKKALQNRPNREENLVLRLKNDQHFLATFEDTKTKHTIPKEKPTALNCVLALPVYVLATVLHFPAYLTIQWIVRRFVTDFHWTTSIKFAAMMFVAPPIYIAQSVLLYQLTGSFLWVLSFILLLPLTAIAGIKYHANCLRKS